ncbi:MAG: alpha-L-fucosidase [Kiritimatiellae bacterium]|nr:alpha-L-fucosidase [Kiritimatiellia bacterium]
MKSFWGVFAAVVTAVLVIPAVGVYAAAEVKAAGEMSADAIMNGTHGYMPANYVVPKEPEVRAKLEKFKDLKLALMIHWGVYAQIGSHESWPLVDKEAAWSRDYVDWAEGEDFKRQYLGLNRSFNPVCFEPEKWASLAARNGFKYVVFTTKHHDGFCMYDSKYSDFKVTAPECPFSKNKRADVAKEVFNAFRARGLWISCYFSKPDWHHPDYWDTCGLGWYTTRMPSYDVKKSPERWARFREYTKNQILELVRGYGPIDVLWLDGGQVQSKTGLDINIEEIVAEARAVTPDLIAADRTAGGVCENVITPEQTIPPEPLAVPWESCITMGTGFSYRFDDVYKPARELVRMLVDIVAKGGNLALNVAPGPDGRIPRPAVENLDELGAWLKANGEAIYATRPAAPYRRGEWGFTGKGKSVYAIFLKPISNARATMIPYGGLCSAVTQLATGEKIPFKVTGDGIVLSLSAGFRGDTYADVFRID